MLDAKTLARAKGEVKTPAASNIAPSIECACVETDAGFVITIPKRFAFDALTPTAEKKNEKTGEMQPPGYVYAKLKFPEVKVVGFGTDADGKDTEITFASKNPNSLNLFLKI